jgi:polyisoprenoid-binding protein YceI
MVDRVIAEASGEVVVDTGSFASGVALRDDAMRAPDWLNTQTYPFGRLIVNRLAADETVLGVSRAAEVVAHGTLEIRGIQQETTADVTLCYMPPHLLGDPDARLFINGKLVIDITRFGMNIPRQYIARINPQIVISVHLLARGSRASSSGETLLRVARPPSGATGPD